MRMVVYVTLAMFGFSACSRSVQQSREVDIYVSEDRVFSESANKDLEKATCLAVHPSLEYAARLATA